MRVSVADGKKQAKVKIFDRPVVEFYSYIIRPVLSRAQEAHMKIVLLLLSIHYIAAVFIQSFFLHRYVTHRQFCMNQGWERFFHLMTYLILGIGYLQPRAYAEMHRAHHLFADKTNDPHAPSNAPNFIVFVYRMYFEYHRYEEKPRENPDHAGRASPEWPLLDRLNASVVMKLIWIGAYGLIYYACGIRQWWQFLFIVLHIFLSGLQGVLVNWCGHRYGYRNFETPDESHNTPILSLLIGGEPYQNNHHQYPGSPNFAVRWHEIDPCYQVMRILAAVGIISFRSSNNTA